MGMNRRAALAALFVAAALPASAYVVGGSNLGVMGYPEMTCRAPLKPIREDDLSMRFYLDDRSKYISCVKDYVAAGDADIKRIQEAQEQAIDQAKRDLGD